MAQDARENEAGMEEVTHIGQLIPDPQNARTHNERNIKQIVDSLQEVGAARSIVLDEDNIILAGNGVIEAAGIAGIENVRVVEADGNEIIAVRRSGLTPEQKRRLALWDNRAGELSTWNGDVLAEMYQEDPKVFENMFSAGELDSLIYNIEGGDWGEAMGALPDSDRAPFQQMTFTLHDTQAETIKEALSASKALGAFETENENSNGNALARICEMFLGEHGQG